MVATLGWNLIASPGPAFGKLYHDWLEEWEKWLISDYPDRYNRGPVYFTRGVDCERPYGRYVATDDKKLLMSTKDAIFHVVIAWMNTSNTDRHLLSSQARINDVIGSALNFEPKENNAKIIRRNPDGTLDEENIQIDYSKHLTVTREFTITIPEYSDDDESKDKDECVNLNRFLDHPIEPGDNLAVTAAYCFFIQPTKPGNYYLTSTGNAENNYTTTTFIEIEVVQDERDVQNKMVQNLINKPTPTTFTYKKGSKKTIEQIINDLFN